VRCNVNNIIADENTGRECSVKVGKGKFTHEGIFLGHHPIFDQVMIGLTYSTVPGLKLLPGMKYISIFHTKLSKVKFLEGGF
jgi:hypothetical protein